MVERTQLFLTVTTGRLHLRPVREEDWWDLYQCISDPAVMRFEPPLTDDQRREWADNGIASNDFWAICLPGTGQMIGYIYLGRGKQDSWEIGYMLKTAYQKQGFATEALGALVCRTFHIEEAHRIYAFCNRENTPSWKLLERLGFRREGLIRQNIYFRQGADGRPLWQDTLIYGILREEWPPSQLPARQDGGDSAYPGTSQPL